MKRVLIPGGAVIGVLVVALLVAPLLIPTDFVRRQIAGQVATWTGRDVTFSGDPEIHLLPDLTVRLRDVALANSPEMDGATPFLRASAITGRLRLLPLLLGRIEVAEFRLYNPRISLLVDRSGRANWVFDRSAVGAQAAKGDAEVASDDSAPRSPLADISLGRVIVRDGTISYDDRRSGRHEEASDVRITLAWPSSREAVTGDGTFIYRDAPVEFNGSLTAPLQLLAGGASPVRFALASTLIRVSVTGTASHIDGFQLEGDTTVTTPSLRRLLAPAGAAPDDGSILGAASISGRMNWIGTSIAFNPAKVELDGNVADGALAFAFGERPGIQGTLALDGLDLTAYADALRAAADAGTFAPEATVDLPLARLGDIDVRLSADRTVIGTAAIGRAAAAVSVKDGTLTLNLGDAQVYGGHGEATLSASIAGGVLSATADGSLDQVATATALAALGAAPAFEGSASVRFNLTASGATWGAVAGSVAGTGTLTSGAGSIKGFDVTRVPAAIAAGGRADWSGATALTAASATVRIHGASVAIDGFHAEGPAFALDLEGTASLIDTAIAFRGFLRLAATASAAARAIPFLAGGTWANPVLLPDIGRTLDPDVAAPGESPRG